MADQKLNVAFLWHQHQPYYKEETNGSDAGIYRMPWVRFHGTKDYFDIPALLLRFPKVKQNFNLVPSLLKQIEDYVDNGAIDRVLHLTLQDPARLSDQEKNEIKDRFFAASYERMIRPYKRYQNLFMRKKDGLPFNNQDILDLQIWYNLAWVGPLSRESAPFKDLFEKGEGFSAEDKTVLIEGHHAIMKKIIPTYRELAKKGQIELSVTPFYHPILPLLCDTHSAGIAMPNAPLPSLRYKHPEDADEQIRLAVTYFEKLFGYRPRGMWPSEGSVSPESVELIAKNGFHWFATDEEILKHSQTEHDSGKLLYQPYVCGTNSGNVNVVFRNHAISDAIGFIYAGKSAGEAVADLMFRMHRVREELLSGGHDPGNRLLCIILDGENCWEHFEQNGRPFLELLFQRLSEDKFVETILISEFLDKRFSKIEPKAAIRQIYSGSWINHNFQIWVGKPEENLAWDLLNETRDFLAEQQSGGSHKDETLREAWNELYIAQGSDWFWWFGDDHYADNKTDFDLLFRYHLRRVYQILGSDPPFQLYEQIMRSHTPGQPREARSPVRFLNPRIEGSESSFFEWLGAGEFNAFGDSDSMHLADNYIRQILYGFNLKQFFIRVDFFDGKLKGFEDECAVVLETIKPVPLKIRFHDNKVIALRAWGEVRSELEIDGQYRIDDIFEAALSFGSINLKPGERVTFFVSLEKEGVEVERRPGRDVVSFTVPDADFENRMWRV